MTERRSVSVAMFLGLVCLAAAPRHPVLVLSPPHAFNDGFPVFRVSYTHPSPEPDLAETLVYVTEVRLDGVRYTLGGWVGSCLGCIELKQGETYEFDLDLKRFSPPCEGGLPTGPSVKCGGLTLRPGPHRVVIELNGHTSNEIRFVVKK